MPLRLNLLAEAKAEEELRRRDPVKRGIWIGAFLVCLMLLWGGLLYIKILRQKGHISELENRIANQNRNYQQISQNEKQLAAIKQKLTDLERLSTNRFLWGSLLNALQKSTVSDIQLLTFRGEQSHLITEGTKPKTNNETGKITIGKLGGATEKIRLQFDGKDSSPTPGDQVGKYKEALGNSPYLRSLLGKTNEITLRGISAPSIDRESGKTMVSFSLECRLPEKTLVK